MYLKHLVIIVSTLICASTELSVDEVYFNISAQLEGVKNYIDIMKVRQDTTSEKYSCDKSSVMRDRFDDVNLNFRNVKQAFDDLNIRLDALIDNSRKKQSKKHIEQNVVDKKSCNDLQTNLDALTDKFKAQQEEFDSKINFLESQQKILLQEISEMKGNLSEKRLSNIFTNVDHDTKTLFDVRVDKLPEFNGECHQDYEPTDCKAATKCTQKSGYYKIYLPGNKAKQIMVYCDMEIAGGNWMHILRRIDGSENFNRSWSDYVNGFGKVESEYWIGLENLYALTQNNGRQALYIYLETVPGVSSYVLYDNFLIGSATEKYKLKSIGSYVGTAVHGMAYDVGHKFSTFDNDNDDSSSNCAADCGGFWHSACGYAEPTGQYLTEGVRWGFQESKLVYYNKIMYFMIRSF